MFRKIDTKCTAIMEVLYQHVFLSTHFHPL